MPQIRQGNPQFNSANTNPLGSLFALDGNYQTLEYLRAHISRKMINGWPEIFTDLTLFGQKVDETLATDEFWWPVNDYDRTGIIVAANTVGGQNSVAIPVVTTDGVFVDMKTGFENGSAVVTAVNPQNNTVTLSAPRGVLLPNFTAGQPLSFMAPSTSFDRVDVNFRYRMKPKMLKNYIEIMAGVVPYNWDELQKIGNGELNAIANFLGEEFNNFILQMKTSARNSIWASDRGEFILAGNRSTKSTGGIRWFMQNYGANTANPTLGNFADTIQVQCRLTQFKMNKNRKYLFAAPHIIEAFMETYKSTTPIGNVRYAPNDMIANLKLSEVDYLTATVIPVSMPVFTDTSAFSRDWGNLYFLVDAEYVETKKRKNFDRTNDLDMSKFSHSLGVERMMQTSIGVQMSLPQVHAWGTVS